MFIITLKVQLSNKQSGIKSRGTKDLMRALQDTIKEEDIEDVDGNDNEE